MVRAGGCWRSCPSTMGGSCRLVLLSVACLTGATGCTSDSLLILSEWRLETAGASQPVLVELPRHLDDSLPPQPATVRLTKHVMLPEPLRGRSLTLAIPQLRGRAELLVGGISAPPMDADMSAGYRGND